MSLFPYSGMLSNRTQMALLTGKLFNTFVVHECPDVYVGAGITGLAVIGYSIYFDHKRRSAPDYKQKIRENRKRKQQEQLKSSGLASDFPDPRDPYAMEQFFLREMTLGEEDLASDRVEQGLTHIANAVVACPGIL